MIAGIERREVPSWLDRLVGLGTLPIVDLLRQSLYYPASGRDGDPIRYLAGFVHSFVYVDYGIDRDEVWASLHSERHGLRGYEVLACRDVSRSELTPDGWTPRSPHPQDGDPECYRHYVKPPFALWCVFERKPTYDDAHGPRRLSFLYVCGDGAATFQALYHGNRIAPEVIAIIQPGTAFGYNWTDFADPEKILARSVLRNPYGRPDYLLYGGWGKDYRPACWPIYDRLIDYWHLSHVDGELGLWCAPSAGR